MKLIKNKLVALSLVLLCVLGLAIESDITHWFILMPIALYLFFTKKKYIY
jgi:hypothetical protein